MGFDNRAPVTAEQSFERLAISGRIPDGLRGTLLRNGPNPSDPDEAAHWFIGDGMVHAFRIGPNGVSYRNRWVRTQAWAEARGMSVANAPAGVANTNIISHAGQVLALEEAHLPVAMDPVSLATLGARDFAGALPVGPFTAHPKHDPRTGALAFFGYDADGHFTDTIRIGEIGADGRVTRLETATAPYAAMVHDFAVTERYVAIPLFPLIGCVWRPEQGAWLGVMERAAGIASLRWFRGGAGFAFHCMNAWETDGVLEIDLMVSDAPPFFPAADGSILAQSDAKLCRWRLDLSDPTARVTGERLSDTAGEFSRIDDRFAGRRTRHGYFTTFDALCHRDDVILTSLDVNSSVAEGKLEGLIIKAVGVTGIERFFRMPPGDTIGEPVFVPRGEAEGDGWLLAVIFRAGTGQSDLAIFDASDIEAGPVALAHLPCRVPAGFHGNWVGDAP